MIPVLLSELADAGYPEFGDFAGPVLLLRSDTSGAVTAAGLDVLQGCSGPA